jgi:mannose-1-phosphate guanylyltransferase
MKQAMILAAGLGTRLRPYSLIRPKPLFPVLNKPLLIATIERLQRAGFTRIVVNCHHLAEQIIAAVGEIDGVIIQHEPEILGTGGGPRRALEHFLDAPVLITNGDIYHCVDFSGIYHTHIRSGREITMVLHDCRRFNQVSVNSAGVTGFGDAAGERMLAYTGVQVVNPEVLEPIRNHACSCIIDHYRGLLRDSVFIGYHEISDPHWTDMGTPGDYLSLHGRLLCGQTPWWEEFGKYRGVMHLVEPTAAVASSARLIDWNCVGRAEISAGAVLSRSVVWDGAVVKEVCSDMICIPSPVP